jgi:hypothetical protein
MAFPFPMTYSPLTDYIHLDDHQHNDLTKQALFAWLRSCFPNPLTKKVWFSQFNIIPLRHYKQDEDTMPNTRKSKKPADNTSADWKGFVNVDLTDEEWIAIDKAVSDKKVNETVPGHLDYLLELGKVTFNYTNGSVSCALTILEGAQKGYTVSSFSDNLVEALLTTRLKVQNYLPEFEAIFSGGGGQKRRRG